MRGVSHALGHAAHERPSQAASAVSAEDDQLGVQFLRLPHDHRARISADHLERPEVRARA